MKGVLFLPLLWVLGYLLGDGAFGAKVINGFEWLNTFYYIALWFVVIFMGMFMIVLTFGNPEQTDKIKSRIFGFGFGFGLGSVLWILTVSMVYIYYWLTNEIIVTTNALATQWSELYSTDMIWLAIIIYIINSVQQNTRKKSKEEDLIKL